MGELRVSVPLAALARIRADRFDRGDDGRLLRCGEALAAAGGLAHELGEQRGAGARAADLPALDDVGELADQRAARGAEPAGEDGGARLHLVESTVEVGDVERAVGAELEVVEGRARDEECGPHSVRVVAV